MESGQILISSALLNPAPDPIITCSLPIKPSSSCPWGKVPAVEAISFNDVMSEQLAKSLEQEDNACSISGNVYDNDSKGCGEEITECSDDFLLAKMLQLEFDKEHDSILKHEEAKINMGQKVKISYGKYLRLPGVSVSSDEDDEDKEYSCEESEESHWGKIDNAEKTFQSLGKSGMTKQGNMTTTKHDLEMSGRRNAGKLMSLPTSLSTGDPGVFDMKISNTVFNTLRIHSRAEDRRGSKVHDKKERATTEKALDEKTQLIMYKLMNVHIIDSLSGLISTGKEACVYHAWSGVSENEEPSFECAVKVFKTTLAEFHNREQYIKDDYRFKNRFKNQNPRKLIPMWAEKEMRNLLRMKEARMRCPEVISLKRHVLIMTFIGDNMIPAPKLKDVDLPFVEMTLLYEQTVEIMQDLYFKCKLVHGDLSEYNLLWYKDQLWVIDVSQSVEVTHPRAEEFLLRDCTNIVNFFERRGVLSIPRPEELCSTIMNHLPENSQSAPSNK